jgi:hypothetical protein
MLLLEQHLNINNKLPYYITGVALMDEQGIIYTMPAPFRHNNIINKLCEITNIKPITKYCIQGFILNDKQFVTRYTARILALQLGQCNDTIMSDELDSSDLW